MDEPFVMPKMPFRRAQVTTILWRIARRLLRSRTAWIAAGVLFLAWCGPSSFATYVPPNMIGVKQVYFGSSAGIKNQLYAPGLHFVIAGIERLHLFPHDMQVINFSEATGENSPLARTAPSIKIQTSDGYNVQLDVSVLFRIEDAHRVFVDAGPGRAFEDRLVIPRADRILRKTLGELNSEEFYQGPRRIEKANAAHQALKEELAPFGIAVDAVLVQRYVYDIRYQQLIEGRKIRDQTVFLREAEAAAAIEQRKRDTAVAEGKATQDVELERGRAEVQKLAATADLYKRKRAAEGKLLVELADAKGTGLENTALLGAGAENLVGLKMADVLKGLRVIVLSSDGKDGFNPLDMQALLKKFEVR